MAAEMICSRCGSRGKPKNRTKGYFLVEVILWCCFIVPGVIYSLWRQFSKAKVCPSCGAEAMIPLDSPMGQKLAAG
jgi:hypothetical protein